MPPDIKESFRVATLLTGVPPTDPREVNRVFRTNPAEINNRGMDCLAQIWCNGLDVFGATTDRIKVAWTWPDGSVTYPNTIAKSLHTDEKTKLHIDLSLNPPPLHLEYN
jgi:hypothetical protein